MEIDKYIFIAQADGSTTKINIKNADSVLRVKEIIEKELIIPRECQKLYNRVNKSTMVLEENYKFSDSEIVYLTVVISDMDEELEIYKRACKENNFQLFKRARELGVEWDESVCEYAARYNRLEILKWARENG